MYEPKYLPQLTEESVSLPEICFAIVHSDKAYHRDDPNADPLHVHQYLEIFFNISSDVSFLVNNNLYSVPIGSAVISRPGDIHMCIFNRSAVHEHVCFWIDAGLDSPLFSFLHKADFSPLFSFDEQTKKKLFSLIFSLLDVCQHGGSALEKTCYMLQILTIFEQKKTHQPEQTYIPETLQKILDDIHENFAKIRNVNDILSAHFISSSTLTRWFRKYLHTSPREYLESVRLSNAAVLLANGFSVTEACMRSGFSDCSHFIITFRKKFGETPLRYKKAQTESC